MRITIMFTIFVLIVCTTNLSKAEPMGTAFTYQGRLMDANSPADGLYDFEFKLFQDPNGIGFQIGPTIVVEDHDVIDGYFTVGLDFGNKAFDGNARWLEIGVRMWDSRDRFIILSPRQGVTPAPYAIYAESTGGDNDWMVSGSDMYSIPSGNIGIGTTSPAAKLTVDGAILRDGSTIHGSYGYTHINLGVESTTGESGANHACVTVGGGVENIASNSCVTISGGHNNTASGENATISGGKNNIASDFYATVGGGNLNTAEGTWSTVGGGTGNTASNTYSTVAGGLANIASGSGSIVAGGRVNTASGTYSVVCGGFGNIAGGDYSFASGRWAKANHDGSVVWADSTDEDFVSTGNDQFLIHASGGVGIGTAAPETKLDVSDGIRVQGLNYGYGAYPSTGAGMEIFYRPSDNMGLIQVYDRDANSAQAWGNLYLGNGSVGIATQSPGSYKLAVNGNAAKPGGGSWSNFSDGRLKKVGDGFERGLTEIIKLNPVRYSYRDDNELDLPADKEFVGLVAQEVRDIVPEAVEENENGFLMVNNDPIIWMMVNAIKELKAENESLIDKFKTQNRQIQQRLEALEKMIQQKN